MTVFNNAIHTTPFLLGDRLTDSERIHASDMIISAMIACGVFGTEFVVAGAAPADTSVTWVDSSTQPARVWKHDGTAWSLADFDDIWPFDDFVRRAGDDMFGPLRMLDGSAAAPALTFDADQDSGWFRTGSGEIGYAANGNLILTIGPNGLTTVGTSTQVNSTDLAVKDNTITLNEGETAAGVSAGEAGIDVDRGTAADARLLFNEATDVWEIGIDGALTPVVTAASSVGAGADLVQSLALGEIFLRSIIGTNSITVTQNANDITISVQNATTATRGIVELATDAEVIAGTDANRVVTASSLASKLASTTELGLVEEATSGEVASATAAGGTGGRLYMNPSRMSGAAALASYDAVNDGLWARDVSTGDMGWVDADSAIRAATTAAAGIVELATNAEAQAGTDATRAVTPASLASKLASTTALGLVEEATAGEINASTATGGTGARLYMNPDRMSSAADLGTYVATNDKVWALDDSTGQMGWVAASSVAPAATATASGAVELATNAETQAGTDATRAVTPAGLASLTATTTRDGIVELATNAEVQAGTDTTRAVTPAALASLTATATRAGLVELATVAETLAGTDTTRAVTPDGLFDATVVEKLLENGWDQQPNISAAEIAALSGDERLLIELDDGTLRQVRLDSLPRSVVTDNGTTITHSDGYGTSVTFREGRSYFNQAGAPAAPEIGDHWWQSTDEVLYERVSLGGTATWVEISGGSNGGQNGVVGHGIYTPGTLPPAANYEGGVTYVTGAGGAGGSEVMVYSDGTNWRKVRNANIVA